MNAVNRQEILTLLKRARVRASLVRELRFTPEEIDDWEERELLPVFARSGNEGVLLIELGQLHVLPFKLRHGVTNKSTGRTKPITCDFCYTWQPGGNAASITFPLADRHTVTYLCCADLNCGAHVRSKTPASLVSRTQLPESITSEERIARLRRKLQGVVNKTREQYTEDKL